MIEVATHQETPGAYKDEAGFKHFLFSCALTMKDDGIGDG
jgi:hypothetical protein